MEFPSAMGGELLKWVAVGVAIIIEVGAVFFVVMPSVAGSSQRYTFQSLTLPTTHTTRTATSTSANPAPSITVKSAVIENDTLSMDLVNKGTVSTISISLSGVCTPDFVTCFSYPDLGGKNPTGIFILPPGGEFKENITGVCVVPETGCNAYYPVGNFTYYLVLKFTAPTGTYFYAPVIARGNNTYPGNSAVQGVVYSFNVFSKNLSGSVNAYIATNSSEDHAGFVGNLYMESGKSTFTYRLLANTTGCGGKYSPDCSAGNVTMTMPFSTVTSGIATKYFPGPYLLVVRDLTLRRVTYFAMWVNYKQVQ